MSYLLNVDKKIKYQELKKMSYLTNKKTKQINKVDEFIEGEKFKYKFINEDTIYYNEFIIRSNPRKPYVVLTISSSIKAPFSLDIFSLKSTLGK
jgi:hypothetical protein